LHNLHVCVLKDRKASPKSYLVYEQERAICGSKQFQIFGLFGKTENSGLLFFLQKAPFLIISLIERSLGFLRKITSLPQGILYLKLSEV
jgi:hypothetical protein